MTTQTFHLDSYRSETALEIVERMERRAAMKANIAWGTYCANCETEFSARKAITFCGDCSMELCKPCAKVCCVDTYCPFCLVSHQKGHLLA
jgi:methionyl-tRNA synthetase